MKNIFKWAGAIIALLLYMVFRNEISDSIYKAIDSMALSTLISTLISAIAVLPLVYLFFTRNKSEEDDHKSD